MRGTFFQSPMEYTLVTEGESWHQGDEIKGFVQVKSHLDGPIEQNLKVLLAQGATKAVEAQDPEAFKTILENPLTITSEKEQKWKFSLKNNDLITEKNKSLYLVVCSTEDKKVIGHLRLNILPHKIVSDFLEIMRRFLRFEVKPLKNKVKGLDAKCLPPSSKELGAIEQLNINLNMDEENNLQTQFVFKVKKLNYDAGQAVAKSEKVSFNLQLSPKEYFIYGESFNGDLVKNKIDEILENVTRSTTY